MDHGMSAPGNGSNDSDFFDAVGDALDKLGDVPDQIGVWARSAFLEAPFSRRFDETDYSTLPVPDLSDPIWGEIDQGSLKPFVSGLSFPEQAAEWGGDRFENLGTAVRGLFPGTDVSVSESPDPAMHLELGNIALPGAEGRQMQRSNRERYTHRLIHAPWPAYASRTGADPAEHLEDSTISLTTDEGLRIEQGNLGRYRRSLEDVRPTTQQVSEATGTLRNSIHDLDGGVGALGGTMDLATLGLDGMSTSMGVGGREALAFAGQMGTLEDQFLAVTLAAEGLQNLPTGLSADWALTHGLPAGLQPPNAEGLLPPPDLPPTRPGLTPEQEEERRQLLASPPPPNVQEIFLSQRKHHDLSGFRNAEHWWAEHLKHVAQLTYGYAQGTSFAPGGLALVGEMGPELVNLPRGSQVIPNPRLGGDVHVHVTVQGSVVAERDLAQRIRQELIRTSRRTVDLGFSS